MADLALSDIQAAPGAPPAAPVEAAAAPVEAAAAPEATAPPSTEYSGPGTGGSQPAAMLETLPEELLSNPLIFAVAKGQPAAVSAPDKSKDPAVQSVIKHAQPLVAAGFGIYHSKDKKNWVLFNTQTLHPGDLVEADKEGKLLELAPLFDTVQSTAPGAAPAAGEVPQPGAVAPSQPAPSVQNKLASIRGKNLQPGTPTSGPAPGAGNILNSILKRTV